MRTGIINGFYTSYTEIPIFKEITQKKERNVIRQEVFDEFKYNEKNPNSQLNEQLKKQNNLLKYNVLALLLVGSAIILAPLLKNKSGIKDAKNIIKKDFESLAERNDIPTLNDCKNLNKNLKDILEKKVDFINSSNEARQKAGKSTDNNLILLYGPPGVGKTFFAQILAKTTNADFMEIKFADFNSRWAGEDIEKMQSLFDDILSKAGANPDKRFVVAFNEIDTSIQPIDRLRNFSGSGHLMSKIEERSTLLNYLDSFAKTPNVTVVGTTNLTPYNNGLDGAVLSRFSELAGVDYPSKEALFETMKFLLNSFESGKKVLLKSDKELKELTEKMAGRNCSYRDLNKVISNSKDFYLKDVNKNFNTEYEYEYLKKGYESLRETDGEIAAAGNRRRKDEGKSNYFSKLWRNIKEKFSKKC
ncbi:AAA family ATPase [bacterium]|nr:AAA family ATPase [bacterium]